MVNRNRWSWSGGPWKPQARDDVATSQLPLVRSPEKPDLYEVDTINDSRLQPTATSVSSRRLSRNRWSWRPDTAITVTLEDQQETEQGGKQDGDQDLGRADHAADSTNSANIKRRLSKHFNKTETAYAAPDASGPAPLPLIPNSPPSRSRPRPSSMIAPASASFDTSPSYRNSSQRWAQQQPHPQSQQQDGEEQPVAGVKNVFSRLLNRRLSLHGLSNNSKFVPMQQQHHHHPQAPAEPTPPPSRQQQHQEQRPLPMQPPMRRHGPQLHNPQNTIRVPPAPPVTNNTQALIQGHIGNGRVVAPLQGLDENEPLQLSPSTSYPSTAACVTGGATGAAAAQSLESDTASSSTATSSPARIEGPGLFGRLMRRRLTVPKEKDTTDNQKRSLVSTASIDDDTSCPSGADKQMEGSPDAVPAAIRGANEQRQIPPQNRSLQKTHGTSRNETASPDMRPSPKSRFLRQVTKPQTALTAITATAGAAVPRKSKSHSHLQQHLQQSASPSSPSPAEPRLRSKPSYGKRFWSRAGANDFGQDDDCVAKTNTPAQSSAPRAAYVPKHAAADFSRTTNAARHNRHSFFLGNDLHNGVLRPLATVAANSQEDDEPEPEPELEPYKKETGRHRTPSAEQAEKRGSRDLPSSTKYEAPSPMELHRRLEIVKSSEVEVVTTREPATADSWQHQLNLLRDGSNTPSSSNGKAPAARSHSRPRSSQRHSFNLVSDPHARELTPPKSASPVEMEAPFDPPSQTPQQVSSPAPPRPTSFYARPLSRQDSQSRQPAAREMSDFERFLADAEVAEREHHAQMWRNLARRSGHYGYSNGPWSSVQPAIDPFSAYAGTVNATAPYGGSSNNNMNTKNKRHSAYYSVGNGKRASMMSFGTAFEERKVTSPEFYGQPTVAHSSSVGTDKRRESLQRQGSVSKRISAYIKPPKPSQEPTYEDWPAARGNRRSVIAGATEG
ncbi:hypothetical protein CH63R_05306 [Colletotrichum higginsianum IMI 349063]|uniref:Uncharacterized protein n=3 Tax=Colletotrichum higginsianum TaxID=80884 RepID=A0A1B7YLU0_COLHI|nr:hypothetical protein CH63R_05306 [Colletotrichum higginsianum IMI 349063]OBR13010.1 hypothetical protein CH63R_05306 [Colletotrichum higginsianum IMI 349063]